MITEKNDLPENRISLRKHYRSEKLIAYENMIHPKKKISASHDKNVQKRK